MLSQQFVLQASPDIPEEAQYFWLAEEQTIPNKYFNGEHYPSMGIKQVVLVHPQQWTSGPQTTSLCYSSELYISCMVADSGSEGECSSFDHNLSGPHSLHRQVLTWGAGMFGQLGNQVAQDCVELQNITRLVSSEPDTVVQVKME